MNKPTISILLVVLCIIGGGFYYFMRDVSVPTPATDKQNKPVKSGHINYIGNELSEVVDGKTQWTLAADQIEVTPNQSIIKLTAIKAKIYEISKQGTINLTAQQGQMDTIKNIVNLTGNVRAVSEIGAEFKSNNARWLTKERRFFGEGNVFYREKGITITGNKMEADDNFSQIKVQGNAQALLRRE